MEKKLSHSQNYTDFACEHALLGDVRRGGKGKCGSEIQNSKLCQCRFFFPVTLLSFSAKSLLASEQGPRVYGRELRGSF